MTNVYKFSRPLFYLLTFCSTSLFLLFFVALGTVLDGTPIDHWIPIIFGITTGGSFCMLTYFIGKSKITTSPEHIVWELFWIRVESTWDNVEGLIRNGGNGPICLTFTKPIHDKHSILFFSTGNNVKTLDLSNYIDDSASHSLLDEIANYVPTKHNKWFANKFCSRPKTKWYEKAEIIGIYHLFWIFFQIVPIVLLLKFASRLFSTDITKMAIVTNMMWGSLVIGLLISGMSLLGFNEAMAKANRNEISHIVRSYYLNPFVIVFLGFIVGLGIWISKQESSFMSLISIVIGGYSMQISTRLEMLIFRGLLDK